MIRPDGIILREYGPGTQITPAHRDGAVCAWIALHPEKPPEIGWVTVEGEVHIETYAVSPTCKTTIEIGTP